MSVKIETLVIRNFKRVEIAEVEIGQNGLTVLGGKNKQGKSTFLDAICALLGGKKYMPTNPHNENADGASATLRATLSNGIEVERSGKNSTLKVHVNGQKGNQRTLDEFINEFALNIPKFMRATEKEKADMLLKHLGIGDRLQELDEQIKHIYGERTTAGSEAERKDKLAQSLVTYDEAPSTRVVVSDLIFERDSLVEQNRIINSKRDKVTQLHADGITIRDEIAELEAKLASKREALAAKGKEYKELKDEVDKAVPHDINNIDSCIRNAESLNLMYDANEKAKAAESEAKEARKVHKRLDDAIKEAREKRQALMESIGMPLPELVVEEGTIKYKGQQWDCMSGAERLMVATAISRAFKPECGFVLVDELEQMDSTTLEQFHQWAESEAIQIIGAMVCDEDKAGENVIIISDGRVKE